jgi:dTDP-4-dehydrorhamnose 3,5-epimerase
MAEAWPAMSGFWALHPLRQFPDDRGAVLHMLRANDAHFQAFGEIYFSTILHGKLKAWHLHRRKTVNLAVPIGLVRVVLYRAGQELVEQRLGREEYQLLTIEPGTWYGFQGLAPGESLIANCATEPFDPAEGDSLSPDTDQIPYRWDGA